MGEAVAVESDLEDCEVGLVGVFVVALLGCPSENVDGEVWVGLGEEGLVDVVWGEAGFEVGDPCLELFL